MSRFVPGCPLLSDVSPFLAPRRTKEDKQGQTGHFGTNQETPPFRIHPQLALLDFLGYSTSIAWYVAEWDIALICLCKNKNKAPKRSIAPCWGSAGQAKRVSRDRGYRRGPLRQKQTTIYDSSPPRQPAERWIFGPWKIGNCIFPALETQQRYFSYRAIPVVIASLLFRMQLLLLTVGSFLPTVELLCLQWCSGTFFAYNLSFFSSSLGFFTYSWSFITYSEKEPLISKWLDCKPRGSAVSKTAPTVSKQAFPLFFRASYSGFHTIVVRYVAKRGIAQMCLWELKCQGVGVSHDGVSQRSIAASRDMGPLSLPQKWFSFRRMHFSARKCVFLWKDVDVTGTSQKTAEICERVSGVENQER